MKRIILDTNFYSAFKKNDATALELLKRVEYIGVNTVILGELLAGFRCGNREQQNRLELDQFLDSPRVATIAIDDETAEFYAQVFSELRQKGRPIPSNDLWLAASALQHGLALATYDDHFSAISGLLLAVRV
ncbi:type II toxin-antitoxin system VapC family toxin [Geobacter benzoatilyticus]|jgi:predicted nucleic acid-binding protein|uniref:Ribonuclease VapC n=1 Tax=Geobacter benzoatilyticus TaxID=2815309 RepID=A0ABX7PZ25_9BACT|nr:type II toxin-antitoxin system VapC family toxin [Geobacter benzoatilyticus]QSV44398.1 type II toxin-antitoxin system VapC family toxin [Geobacter benzoatilyticus]